MSANIKIGGNTVNGVNTIKVENADQVGQYVTFTNLTPVEETVTPTTATQEITPQEGEMLSKVTVNPVTASIDANIVPQNIKSGVSILGVTGEYEAINKIAQYANGSLTSIDEDDLYGVTSIKRYAFPYSDNLLYITIPSSVSRIGQQSFRSCPMIVSITIKATTPPTLENANAFTDTGSGPIYVPAESVDTYKSASNWSSLASRIQAIPS